MITTDAAREERGRGSPLDDAQRVARHYNISLEEACQLLTVYTPEQLLPERGYGLAVPTTIVGSSITELYAALNNMEASLPTGGKAQLELCSQGLPTDEELAFTYLNLVAAGFHTSYPTARIVQGIATTRLVLTKGSPQWAALIPLVPTVVIVGLIAFGITQIETISKALLPLLITVGVTGVLIAAMLREPARRAAERTTQRYIPSTIKNKAETFDIPFAQRLQAEMMKEMRQPFRELLTPGKFPKRDKALEKLGDFTIAQVHDDGDLTIRSGGKLWVVTTEGQTFEERAQYSTTVNPGYAPYIYETKKSDSKVVNKFSVAGTDLIVYEAWEPSAIIGKHGTLTSIEDKWYGRIGTRYLPPEIEELPRGDQRTRAVGKWHDDQYEEAYALITRAFPESKDGRRSMGEITLHWTGENFLSTNPRDYITISFKGDTTFKVGEIVLPETFKAENERVRKLRLRPARGWSKSKGVLKSWGNGEKPSSELEEYSAATFVACPICGKIIEVPEYDKISRSDALRKHIEKEHPIKMLAKTEGNPLSKFCCSQCGTCAPEELLEEGRFPERIAWLRSHYKEEHPGMWGKVGLTPQTEDIFKSGEVAIYKGERVRVSEQIGDHVEIFIPSRQESVWVKPDKLERVQGEKQPAVDYLADSAEFLTYTIDSSGHRQALDEAFTEALARVRK